jgi:FAD/FMN-containing dehydrogenase
MQTHAIEAFARRLRGPLLRRGDPDYDAARRVYNAMIDKHPRFIARCTRAADVVAGVEFAREHDLPLAVRGGGHSGAGLGTCDDGLVLDLGPMKGIQVDPATRTLRAQAGCTWGDVDRVGHPFGLTVPAGIISTTGIAGLTLGGGHGYLTRRYGLTIDHLLAADVVLANGEQVTASRDQHPDLFWALRGGGGNFGIVTQFAYQARPVHTVTAGVTLWALDHAREVMQWYRAYLPAAPDDLYGFFALLRVPAMALFPAELHGRTMAGVVWCHCGPAEQAEAAFRARRGLCPPVFEQIVPMAFPVLQSLFDALYPPGLHWYWKGDFVTDLPDAAIDQHVRFGSSLPSALATMHLYPIDGAASRVSADATAFRFRHARWSMAIAGIDPDPRNAAPITHWAREYWRALQPYSAGAGYVNFMMDEGAAPIRATFGDNYARLVEVKGRYDPENLFRVNQNIPPPA